jgi:ABC-type nickel/cobalt efflux system permease component RcnA
MDSMIGNIIKIVLSFLGIIFLVLIIQAGYLWMTAQGDQAKVQKAKDIMERAVIGLIIVVGAYAISEYVILSVGRGQLNNLESAQ